jgi:uncharacterized membrane protein YgcG
MYSTRRELDELSCAFRMTEPATAASRTTLLVMLSSALSMYVPGARTMRSTPVLASALFRATVLLTTVVPGEYGGGGGGGGDGEGGGGEGGGGEGGDGGGQVETLPKTPVRVVAQEQTVSPLTRTLGPSIAELE